MKQGLVSIIILNFNRRDLLEHCLLSVQAQDHPACEVIVVDNGSDDGSREFLAAVTPPIKCVLLDSNTGFTGGNIAGMKLAQGEFIALVNNDAELAADWVRVQLQALKRFPEAGYCACKILRHATPDILDCAGGGMTTSARGFNEGEGLGASAFNEPRWVFWATAAAVLYRRSMLEDIGFLDPTFFFGCEDFDLGFRAQLRGWKCRYVPEAVAYHHVNASYGLLKGKAGYFHSRNIELSWLKNMPSGLLLRYLHHHLLHEAAAVVKRWSRPADAAAVLLGKLAVIPLLAHVLKERRYIQARRKISPRQLEGMLTPFFSQRFLRRHRAATHP